MDPDEVFQQHKKTCSLDEVFTKPGERWLHEHCTLRLTVPDRLLTSMGALWWSFLWVQWRSH